MRRFVNFQLIATVLVGSSMVLAVGCGSDSGQDPRAGDPQSDDVGADPGVSEPSAPLAPGAPTSGDTWSKDGPAPVMDPLPKSGTSGTALDGEACEANEECASSSCVDGVCCNTACKGACESCNSPGQEGKCSPHAYGTDPENECGAPACYSGMAERFFCDGVGACQVETMDCGLYLCGGHACYLECRTDDECVEAAWCNLGRCEEK